MLNRDFVNAANLFKKHAQVGLSNTSAHEAKEYICERIPNDFRSFGVEERIYKIKGTVGQGRTVEVPWIAIMKKSITQSTTRGIYIVYLFSADMKQVFVSLMMGCEYFNGQGHGKTEHIRKIANRISKLLIIPESFSSQAIDLKGHTTRVREYEAANIIGKNYDIDSMPQEQELAKDLFELLEVYDQLNSIIGKRTVEEFYEYVSAQAAGLEVDYTESFSSNDDINDEEGITIPDDKPEKRRKPVVNAKGQKSYPRDRKKAKDALKYAKYKCEVDDSHFSFLSAKGKNRMYVEAHHLIPLSQFDKFESSLDVEANIVSLCPNCHRCIHNGCPDEKQRIIETLWNRRKDRLKRAGIAITKEALLRMV